MESMLLQGRATMDGAGVKLTRIFAHEHTRHTDPFLLLDHFGSDRPEDYIRGFPWHPHRGIETVTYMLGGEVEHGDSLGNAGKIGPGEIQWMTAGGGIIHQEMPKASKHKLHGLQLWVNLPAKDKMMAPRYRGITADQVPVVKTREHQVKVIAGTYEHTQGPVKDLVVEVEYLDVQLQPHASLNHHARKGFASFCYVLEGGVDIGAERVAAQQLLLLNGSGDVQIKAHDAARYIWVSGQKLHEPVAWGGPIVMNTQAELELAFRELDAGTFIKG